MSSMQSDFRRLMSEIYENTHKVIVHDPNLDSEINSENSKVSPHKETDDGPYIFDGEEFELFQQMASAYEDDAWEEYKDPMDEMTNSSEAGAYNASLNATPKQYKGPEFKENSNSGYKKIKGFRAGHTKDKGGFQYKDLWNVNEDQFNELVSREDNNKINALLNLIKDKVPELFNKFRNWMLDPYITHDYEYYKQYTIDYVNKAKERGINLYGLNLSGINEREQTKLDDLKVGDKIVIDKSVNDSWRYDGFGKIVAFEGDQVIVDITNGGGSTFTRSGVSFPKEKISLQKGEIDKQEKKKEKKAMEKEPIKEGLKTEIKVRSKKQQFQEATKLANKKLREINTILEFASNLKQGLNEAEYSSSSKSMESMKKNIAEAYKKMKNL